MPVETTAEPFWHVHAQCNTSWEAEHRLSFAEAIHAGHEVVERAADERLPAVVKQEAHGGLDRLDEEAVPPGTWYHYEYHPWPNLFLWLGKVEDGGVCLHCEREGNRPRAGLFKSMVAVARIVLTEGRKSLPGKSSPP